MENERQTETAPRPGIPADGLTPEGLLERMDAIRREMYSMKELAATMETIVNRAHEDDGGPIAEAAGQAFAARERTCQQQLAFLEKVYFDRFSAPSGADKTARMNMILDKMNSAISMLNSGDDIAGALNAVIGFYSSLLEKA